MESEGCWEVITCRPYEHHVSLGCSQTCLSFPLWTDLTPAVTWRGIHSVWSLRSFFFLISTRLSHGLWIWMSFSLLLSYRMPGPTESLTSWPCMEIMRSSGVLQQIPPRTSRSHVLFSYLSPPLPLSSWVGARRTLIWHQPPSVTNLNCCVMNYEAGAGAVELFCVTNIPPESAGYSDRWMGGDCWQKVCIWCHLQSVCMNGN